MTTIDARFERRVKPKFYILGSGGLGREVREYAFSYEYDFVFVGPEGDISDEQFIEESSPDDKAIIAVGDPGLRYDLSGKLLIARAETISVVHKLVHIANSAYFNGASIIAPLCSINHHVTVGYNSAVLAGAIIGHDTTVGPHSVICPGAVISGHVTIGERVLIGANATVLPGVKIGDEAVVGAATIVVNDVPAGGLVAGSLPRFSRTASGASRIPKGRQEPDGTL